MGSPLCPFRAYAFQFCRYARWAYAPFSLGYAHFGHTPRDELPIEVNGHKHEAIFAFDGHRNLHGMAIFIGDDKVQMCIGCLLSVNERQCAYFNECAVGMRGQEYGGFWRNGARSKDDIDAIGDSRHNFGQCK